MVHIEYQCLDQWIKCGHVGAVHFIACQSGMSSVRGLTDTDGDRPFIV